jgi:MFS family permease
MPTLWLFVSHLGGTLTWQGIAIASFSMGRIITSPIFGKLSETHGYKIVLFLCNLVILAGCLVYAFSTHIWVLVLGQFIIG